MRYFPRIRLLEATIISIPRAGVTHPFKSRRNMWSQCQKANEIDHRTISVEDDMVTYFRTNVAYQPYVDEVYCH
jgi:hypothetical protein